MGHVNVRVNFLRRMMGWAAACQRSCELAEVLDATLMIGWGGVGWGGAC